MYLWSDTDSDTDSDTGSDTGSDTDSDTDSDTNMFKFLPFIFDNLYSTLYFS